MKVCTCLNPLHTTLAVYGCLLGYTKISEEMKDADLVKLVEIIGYKEGLPVVTDPGILLLRSLLTRYCRSACPILLCLIRHRECLRHIPEAVHPFR